MANGNKISACFLCLRNIEKAGHGYSNCNGDVDHTDCDSSGDLLLLKRFLSWSLDLPPAVIGDLLCTNVGTGQGEHQRHGENLLCGNCSMEMGAACQLFQELAKKLMKLEEILENSVKKVSDKLNTNLHQKVAKQLNHSFGSTKEGGRRVQRLRDLLALKLATAKTKYIADEVTGGNRPGISESGNEIEDFQGVHHENRNPNEPETEAVDAIVKVESDQGEDESEANGVDETVEENEGMDLGVAKDKGGHRHRHGSSNSTSASTAKGKENRGLVVEGRFTCLKCSESFMDMDSVQRHQRSCKPMVSSSSGNGKPMPTPTSGKAKMKQVDPRSGNGRFLREDVDIDVKMEEQGNSSAAAEAEDDADEDVPIQCLRCNDRFKTIQGFKSHQGWCKPLKVQDLEMKPGSAKKKLGRNSKRSKLPKKLRCTFCGKIFCTSHRSRDLKLHERIHTGEKPFQCPKCTRRFRHKWHCKRHLKICKFGRNSREMKNGN